MIRAYIKAFLKPVTRAVIPGLWGNIFDALAPSDLALTVLSDTSIKLDFTINLTNADGHIIERSLDGITYSEIGTVTGTTATYTDTTGSDGTRYYYRVKSYKESFYSAPCTAANDWCAIKMVLTSTGDGTGVSTVRFWFGTTNIVCTLDGAGKWYSDSGGTADEAATYTFVAGALRTRYLKVTSVTSNMLIFAKGNLLRWGDNTNLGYDGTTNSPIISKNIADLKTLTHIRCQGLNSLSGSVVGLTGLTYLAVTGSNTISGSVVGLTGLTYLFVTGSNTISGSVVGLTNLEYLYVSGNNTLSGSVVGLTGLTYLFVTGANTISGDIGGSGTAAFVNGITRIFIDLCWFVDYTSGATWYLTDTSLINPAVGYGYSATEIDNMLIDMAASLGSVTAKTITLKGSSAARTSASDAAVSILNGKGWTVVTNVNN